MNGINEDALKEITNIFERRKFMNVAELTNTYNQKELLVLKHTACGIVGMIEAGKQQGLLLDHFASEFEAFTFKSFVEGQIGLIVKAILYSEGGLIVYVKSLDGGTLPTIFYQN